MIREYKHEKLKSFMKSESDRLHLNIDNVYSTFFLRLLLENISKRNTEGMIIVKGSFAQFAYLGKLVRPIVDIDLTSIESHDIVLPTLLKAIDDEKERKGIKYSLKRDIYQTKNGIYKIKMSATCGSINHSVRIDYRENHPSIYEKQTRSVPTLFQGDSQYDIIVPSLEETLAEKLCIIAERNNPDLLNIRIKDFYDIYQLLGGNYDREKFSYYFEKMIRDSHKISVSNVSGNHLDDAFIRNHETIWNNTERNMGFFEKSIDFGELVYHIRCILDTQATRIRQGKNKVYTISYQNSSDE